MEPTTLMAVSSACCIAVCVLACACAGFLWWRNTQRPGFDAWAKDQAAPGDSGLSAEQCAALGYKGREYTKGEWQCPDGMFDTGITWEAGKSGKKHYFASNDKDVNARQCTPDKTCVRWIERFARDFPGLSSTLPPGAPVAPPPAPGQPAPPAPAPGQPSVRTSKDLEPIVGTMYGCYDQNKWDKPECQAVKALKVECIDKQQAELQDRGPGPRKNIIGECVAKHYNIKWEGGWMAPSNEDRCAGVSEAQCNGYA